MQKTLADSAIERVINNNLDKSRAEIRLLAQRFQSAKDVILSADPTETVSEFGSIETIDGDIDWRDLQKIEADRRDVVELVEARVKSIERERLDSRSEIEKLREMVGNLATRVAILERAQPGRASAPQPTSRSHVPQMDVPMRGTAPNPEAAGVRRLGQATSNGPKAPAMLPAMGTRRVGPGSF